MIINKKYYDIFNYWILGLISLVALIIIVGGITRLTGSGLSITKWELFTGILPPFSEVQWERYFLEYKTIPQYFLLNSSMSLEEFKFIFLWEYMHRLLARLIGLFFFIPFIFFMTKKVFNHNLIIKLCTIAFLILFQGTVGWYMVKSGLIDNVSVSHYRLSIHLFTAFIIFSCLIWILMDHNFQSDTKFFQMNLEFIFLKILLFSIFVQIIIGAFVSGLNAGKIYQTWPLMDGNFFPSDDFINNLFNFSDPSFVQFIHRNIAYFIFILSIYSGIFIYKNKIQKLYRPYLIFILFIFSQVLFGILVLYTNVNIYFASLHQISSIFLVVSSLNLYYRSIKTV